MPAATLRSAIIPPSLRGTVGVRRSGVPRFWALIWLDILKGSLARSTRRSYLSAIDRLYDAAHRRHGTDCLDRLLADADWDAIEDVLAGFLVRLRNEAAHAAQDRSAAWASAVTFVRDIERFNSASAGARMTDVEEVEDDELHH
ncbi:hypothetical protein GGC47_002838 [Bosea sp. OAE752]|jgi:hypothetical protein|uniref:hypothetical protein n=1 Tax=unclassified Bosea (in: a-proteobacteria) TaxID=2653178 RepID=UPI0011540D3D